MKSYYWAILTALVWGCVPVIEKFGLSKLPVWTAVFYRSLGVIVGLIILLLWRYSEISPAIKKVPDGWHFVMIGGFLASVVGQLLFYHALKSGQVSQVTPIGATYPLVSFVLGVLFLKEAVTISKIGGVIFIILGAMLLR